MRAFAFALILSAWPLAFADSHGHHHHDHHDHGSIEIPTVDKKFTPDEDLRVRMEKLPILVKELEGKKGQKKEVVQYGEKVTALVQDIFENCNLEPEPDAALHPVLALILQGAEQLKKGNYSKGHTQIHSGLEAYGNLFDHKGWKI